MTELFHVGLTVKNIERSLVFYRDVVGMKHVATAVKDTEEFRKLTSNAEAKLKNARLMLGQFKMHITEYLEGAGEPLELHHKKPGTAHMTFWVPDVEAKYREVKARGD